MTNITPEQADEALIDWAKEDISKVSAVRFDVAKFFFSVSTFSLGFIPTVWKVLHDKQPFSTLTIASIVVLFISLLLSIYIFWPVFHETGESYDLRVQHENLAKRIRIEGHAWIVLWLLGIVIGGFAVFG